MQVVSDFFGVFIGLSVSDTEPHTPFMNNPG
jgi:hypothetical protein